MTRADDTASLRAYIKEIRALHRPLKKEDEREFMEKIEKGNMGAKETFVAINLLLVVKIAFSYANITKSLTVLDLIQEGNLGLMKAVDKFKLKFDTKFSTYAVWWIRQCITRTIANTDTTVRIPVHAHDLVYTYRKMTRALTLSLSRKPTFDEVAAHMELTPCEKETVRHALVFDQKISLDAKMPGNDDDNDTTLLESVADARPSPEEVLLGKDRERTCTTAVQHMFRELTSREQEILWFRYTADGAESTLASIGRRLKLSRERVRQIAAQARKKCLETPPPQLKQIW